jgi:toxin-antitoxin system PIN domain toxin
VIALDTNILVAAHRRDADRHERVAGAVRSLAEGSTSWAIPWCCIHEFLAIVTHPRIFDPPTALGKALDQVAFWLESPSLTLLAERFDHWGQLRPVIGDAGVRGSQIHDARLAAICLAHGVTQLWTADRDFSRFPRLRTHNPLVG